MFKVTLVFCFGPKPKFCSFDLDLDQAEQFLLYHLLILVGSECEMQNPYFMSYILNILVFPILSKVTFAGDEDPSQVEEIERRISRQGPKPRSFSELGTVQKRKASQQVFDHIKKVSESRQIEPVQLTGYLLKRYRNNCFIMLNGNKLKVCKSAL